MCWNRTWSAGFGFCDAAAGMLWVKGDGTSRRIQLAASVSRRLSKIRNIALQSLCWLSCFWHLKCYCSCNHTTETATVGSDKDKELPGEINYGKSDYWNDEQVCLINWITNSCERAWADSLREKCRITRKHKGNAGKTIHQAQKN